MWHSWLLLFALSLGLIPVILVVGDANFCFPTGNCYTVNTTPLAFDNAKMTCGFKGFLASMKNQQEKNEILNIVAQLQDQRHMYTFWLGLYLPACVIDKQLLYGYVWVSGGDTTEVSEWINPPKPSCTTNKKCVILDSRKNISRSSAVTLMWKDIRCKRKLPSICRSNESGHFVSSTDQYSTQASVTNQYKTDTSITAQHTDISSSTKQVNVPSDLPSFSESALSPSTDLHSASSTSAPHSEDDNLLDRLVIPLILGLVAFGILVMLVWGGAQMCIRKRKPKRRKSIIPALPEAPEGSETDSTDHSSSEEEDDDEEEAELQDRTQDP